MTPRRILNFLKRYLLKHPLYVLVYGVTFFSKEFVAGEHFFSKEEILDKLQQGKSIIRFGDGEINLLLGIKNHYESFSKEVQNMMRAIVRSYGIESPYVLSIPRFVNVSNQELRRIGKFHVWLPLKVMFLLVFPKHVGYMDAHNFYYDDYFEDVARTFLVDKHVVVVTKQETLDKQRNNTNVPWKHASYIPTPATEGIAALPSIKQQLDEELAKLPQEKTTILVAMGPVGKYLLMEYAKKGYQGIDVGVRMETMFTGTSLEHLI